MKTIKILLIRLIEYLYLTYCVDYTVEQEEQRIMKENGLKTREELIDYRQEIRRDRYGLYNNYI